MKDRKGKKHKRSRNTREEKIVRYYIVCEGKETEVNYFKGIKSKFGQKGLLTRDPNLIEIYNIEVKGIGKGADKVLEETTKLLNRKGNIYDNVWLIFDKDDLLDTAFNSIIKKSKQRGYKVGWSNKCFELWLYLYFEANQSDLSCNDYIDKLDKKFKKYINKKGYNKNNKNIFAILEKYSSWKKAYHNAMQLEKS